jgi:hypothetical protein
MKSKISILIAFLVLANLAFANFAFAWVLPEPFPPPARPAAVPAEKITKAEIDNVKSLVAAYYNLYKEDSTHSNPAVQAAYNEANTACAQISSKLYWSTPNPGLGSYFAAMTSEVPSECTFYRVYNTNEAGNFTNIQEDATAVELWNRFESGDEQGIDGFYQKAAETDAVRKEALDNRIEASKLSAFIGIILDTILSVVGAVIAQFAALAGSIMIYATDEALKPGALPAVVTVGWRVIRDLCNMFFILAFIVMSLATILRVESYNYKHVLRNLILGALFINFSQVIAVTIMDAVNFLALTFKPEGLSQVYGTLMRITDVTSAKVAFDGGWMAGLADGIGKIVYACVALATFVALAGLFVVRLVGLYVLIIFSPIAYAGMVLHQTEKYSHEWWHKFVEYLIWAPVAMFMLKLNIFVVRDPEFHPGESAFTFWILAAFLGAAFYVAKKAGMIGSEYALNLGKAVGYKAPMWVGKRGAGLAQRAWRNWTTEALLSRGTGQQAPGWGRRALWAVANPLSAARGWETRTHELEHESKDLATAAGRELADRFWTGGKLAMPRLEFANRKIVNDKMKDYLSMSKEKMMGLAPNLASMKGHEGEMERLAFLKAAFAQGYQDDLLSQPEFTIKYADKDGTFNSSAAINRFLFGFLGGPNGHVNEQALAFMSEDLDDLSRKTKHPEYMGHAYYDQTTGTYKRGFEVLGDEEFTRNKQPVKLEKLKNTWQAKYMEDEWMKIPVRDRVNMAPHPLHVLRAETDENSGDILVSNGKLAGIRKGRADGSLDETQMATMRTFRGSAPEIQHIQPRQAPWMFEGEIDQVTGEFRALDQAAITKIQNLWNIDSTLIRAAYVSSLGLNPREDAKNVNGIKATYYDSAGNKQVAYIGSDDEFRPPAAHKISSELADEARDYGIAEKESGSFRKAMDEYIKDIHVGVVIDSNALDKLRDKLNNMQITLNNVEFDKIKDTSFAKLRDQLVKHYDGSRNIADLDRKYHFDPAEISELSKAVSYALGQAFDINRQQGLAFASDDRVVKQRAQENFKNELRKVIDGLKAARQSGTNEPMHSHIQGLSDDDIARLIKGVAD